MNIETLFCLINKCAERYWAVGRDREEDFPTQIALYLRHATYRLNAGADRVDPQARPGHESISTTQIYSHVGQARMEQVVGRL